MSRNAALWLVLVAACGVRGSTTPESTPPPPVSTIVAEMMATYVAATTFLDVGTATTEARDYNHTEYFTLAFARPDRFRYVHGYDWQGEGGDQVWTAGKQVYTREETEIHVTIEPDLLLGIYSAFGGVPPVVPAMLMPDPRWMGREPWLTELDLLGETNINGHPCWRVAATAAPSTSVLLWIDKNSHLLIRYRSTLEVAMREGGTQVMAQIITFGPRINVNVVGPLRGPDLAHEIVARRAPVPWIGVGFDRAGRRVLSVEAGSPGERAGLAVGDEIVSLDGSPVADRWGAILAVHRAKDGSSVVFGVRRGLNTIRIGVTPEMRTLESFFPAK